MRKEFDIDFTEFNKLVEMCDYEGWTYKVECLYDGAKITLFDGDGNEVDDAVIHSFSFGAALGLLETFSLGECQGFETAEQIFDGWVAYFANMAR